MVCAASGPSINAADLDYCRSRGWHIWAINNTHKLGCDGLYACDHRWWQVHHAATTHIADRWTQDPRAHRDYGINLIRSTREPGFSAQPDVIHQGQNGGYQLLNLVVLWGAARVILLGYDMRADGRRVHWHGDHGHNLPNPRVQDLEQFARNFDSIGPLPCEVLNATPDSAVKRFPRVVLREIP